MINRRDFLRNSALIAAGLVAADQLELLDMLKPRKQYWQVDRDITVEYLGLSRHQLKTIMYASHYGIHDAIGKLDDGRIVIFDLKSIQRIATQQQLDYYSNVKRLLASR